MKDNKTIKSDAVVKASTNIRKLGNKIIVTRITKTISRIGKPIKKVLRKVKGRKQKRRQCL